MERTREKPPVSAKPELFETVFETKLVTVTQGHVDLYAAATNDANGAYSGRTTPPLFAVRYHIPLATQLISDPALTVDLMRLVHGEQEMHFHLPLRVGDVLQPTLQLTGIEHKESGSLMRLRYCLHRGDELANECFTTYFVRATGGKKTKTSPAEGVTSPAFTSSMTVRADQSRHYAEASQDINPIHVSDEMAQMCGFPGVILHGLCSLAFACQAVVANAADGAPERLLSLQARFSKPVLMGDVLTTRGLVTNEGVIFDAVNQDGTPILTQGKATLR